MKHHYWARMCVGKAKMKILKRRLSRALKHRKRLDPLRVLAEASLARHDTWCRVFTPNLRKFEEIFVILKFLACKTGFFSPMRSASTRSLMIGTLSGWKIYIFGFFMVSYACSSMSKTFHQVLDDQKGQKHQENHLSATFCTSRKYLWENEVLEGQMSSKLGNSTWAG